VISKLRPMGLLLAVLALAALPAVSQAGPGHGKGRAHAKSNGHGKCTVKRGFTVRGTLVDDFTQSATKTANSISITVTSANRHARNSGELADQNASKRGVQAKGASFSVTGDSFKYKLVEFEAGEDPAAGDKVKIIGKITYTKKKCAPGMSLAARYGDVNIRKVVIKDAD
jgi:hypothetical protein